MASFVKADITYQSNYNGCYIVMTTADGKEVENDADKDVDAVADKIINKAYEECSPDGHFYGDIDELQEFAETAIREVYGANIEVVFEEDRWST